MFVTKASDVNVNYLPSETNKENIVKRDGFFKLPGDGVFHTIQGEGDSLGQPATFIRLHYCNLQCSWCDTWYTWHTKTKEFYTEPFDVAIDKLRNMILSAQKKQGVKKTIKKIVFIIFKFMFHTYEQN